MLERSAAGKLDARSGSGVPEWLADVPPEWLPNGYLAAVEAEAVAAEVARKAARVQDRITELEAALTASLATTGTDPVDLVGVASELDALHRIGGLMPLAPAVDPSVHYRLIAALCSNTFCDMTAAGWCAPLTLGAPPMFAAELEHWDAVHAGDAFWLARHHGPGFLPIQGRPVGYPAPVPDLPPGVTEQDLAAMAAFEDVSRLGVELHNAIEGLTAPLGDEPIRDRVRAWRALRGGDLWERFRSARDSTRALVDAADSYRSQAGLVHVCRHPASPHGTLPAPAPLPVTSAVWRRPEVPEAVAA